MSWWGWEEWLLIGGAWTVGTSFLVYLVPAMSPSTRRRYVAGVVAASAFLTGCGLALLYVGGPWLVFAVCVAVGVGVVGTGLRFVEREERRNPGTVDELRRRQRQQEPARVAGQIPRPIVEGYAPVVTFLDRTMRPPWPDDGAVQPTELPGRPRCTPPWRACGSSWFIWLHEDGLPPSLRCGWCGTIYQSLADLSQGRPSLPPNGEPPRT